MNRAVRHDALVIGRETQAAVKGWGDRFLVLAGLIVSAGGVTSVTDELSARAKTAAVGAIAGWIGFGLGRLIEQRLAHHSDHYLFAEDVLTPAGRGYYRFGAATLPVILIAALAGPIDFARQ